MTRYVELESEIDDLTSRYRCLACQGEWLGKVLNGGGFRNCPCCGVLLGPLAKIRAASQRHRERRADAAWRDLHSWRSRHTLYTIEYRAISEVFQRPPAPWREAMTEPLLLETAGGALAAWRRHVAAAGPIKESRLVLRTPRGLARVVKGPVFTGVKGRCPVCVRAWVIKSELWRRRTVVDGPVPPPQPPRVLLAERGIHCEHCGDAWCDKTHAREDGALQAAAPGHAPHQIICGPCMGRLEEARR